MPFENADEHRENESSYEPLRIPTAAVPSSYDYGNLSRENPIVDEETRGRRRYYLG